MGPKITSITELVSRGFSIKKAQKYREREHREAVEHMRTAFGFPISKCVAEQALNTYLFTRSWQKDVDPMQAARARVDRLMVAA